MGGGPRVVVSTAAFHARVRVKASIAGSLRDREVACSASDRQGTNFESCVWRTVSSQSSHHPQEVLLAQFTLYVHKGGLKPDLFHFEQYSAYVKSRMVEQLLCLMGTVTATNQVPRTVLWSFEIMRYHGCNSALHF